MDGLSDVQVLLLKHSCGLLGAEDDRPPTVEQADPHLSRAASLITRGAYLEALTSTPQLTSLLNAVHVDADVVNDPASYYSLISQRVLRAAGPGTVAAADDAGPASSSSSYNPECCLVAGVAALYLFVQYNLTGPSSSGPPPSPLDLFAPPAVAAHSAQPPPQPPPGAAAAAIAAVLSNPTTPADAAPAAAAADGPECPPPAPDGLGGLGVGSQCQGDLWAAEQLQLDGEDLVGRCSCPQWLLLARHLLLGPLGLGGAAGGQQAGEAAPTPPTATSPTTTLPVSALPSWPWWALRVLLTHQHALDGRSHTLLSELIQILMAPGSPCVTPPPPAAATDPSGEGEVAAAESSLPAWARRGPTGQCVAAALAGVLHIECALCQYLYGYVEGGRQYLGRAGQLLGLEPQLTGALGKRTVHQVHPKAQLVVVASETHRAAPPGLTRDVAVEALGLSGGSSNRDLAGLTDDSEVFPAPVLVGESGDLLDTRYSAPEQALLLAWATAVKKGTSADDLQEWQMAPWVEAVLSQRRSVFMTAVAARLSKTRHERTRSRTRERALLHMEQLAEAVGGTGVGTAREGGERADGGGEGQPSGLSESSVVEAGRRSVLCWAVWFPLQVALRKEAAEHYVSMGLVGAAIPVFEALEAWDAALTCYRLLGKKALAEELIRRRLAVTPDDPRLWCALGDLHLDDRCYEEAWRRSGERHTRSQRSLARSAMRRKDYAKAAGHWQAALSRNPLHPEAWFSLGFCHLRAEKHREALRAFTRVTQQEPDNGEAWNNIAALWMYLGGYRPAFAALSESVRHKRDSWQTWENYARAALASGHYQAALRGLSMSHQLSSGQRLFLDVVSGLLDVAEGREPPRDGGTSMKAAAAAVAGGLKGCAAEGAEGAAEGEEDGEEDTALKEDEAALGVALLPLLADLPLRPHPTQEGEEGGREEEGQQQLQEEGSGSGAPEEGQHHPASTTGPTTGPTAGTGHAGSCPPDVSRQLLSRREREVVLSGLCSLLRGGVNSPASSPGLWGCLARYWALEGERDAEQEARIKQVRGLSSGAYRSDSARFTEYAAASEALATCYLASYRAGRPGGLKDLAAGRMHLRGLLRGTEAVFEDHPATDRLKALLEEITQLEDAALAASRAARSG